MSENDHVNSTRIQSNLADSKASSDLERMANNLEGGVLFRTIHKPDGSRRYLWISDQVELLFGVNREDVMRDAGILDRLVLPRIF